MAAVAELELYAPAERTMPSAFARAISSRSPTSLDDASVPRRAVPSMEFEHNPFCPTCTPEEENAAALAGASAGVPQLVATSLPLELVATMQTEPPEHSIATLAIEDEGNVGVFSVGDEVLPGVVLAAIGPGMIHVENGGRLEYLLFAPPEPPKAKKKKKKKKKRKKKKRKRGKYEIKGARDAIKCSSKHHCTIERDFVASVLANPASLRKQARFLPKQRDGEFLGFKIYGVRRGTLPNLLKMKSGDMLVSVNDRPLDSLDAAMRLFQEFKSASNLRVTLKRRGKQIEMQYEII